MEELVFPAQIDISRRVSWGATVGLFGILVVTTLIMFISAVRGSRQWIYFLPTLPLLVFGIDKASAATQPRQVLATIRANNYVLELDLPNTRRANGRYIDQLYRMRLVDIEEIRIRHDVLTITAHKLQGIGLVRGEEVVCDNLSQGDITLRVLQDVEESVRSFLSNYMTVSGY